MKIDTLMTMIMETMIIIKGKKIFDGNNWDDNEFGNIASMTMIMSLIKKTLFDENGLDDHEHGDGNLYEGVLASPSPQILWPRVAFGHTVKSHIVLSLCNLRPGRLSTEHVQKRLLSKLKDFALPLPVGFWLQRGFKQQCKCSDQQFRKLGRPVPWVKKNSGCIVDVKIGARHILSLLVVN